jgi:hypothetical protein
MDDIVGSAVARLAGAAASPQDLEAALASLHSALQDAGGAPARLADASEAVPALASLLASKSLLAAKCMRLLACAGVPALACQLAQHALPAAVDLLQPAPGAEMDLRLEATRILSDLAGSCHCHARAVAAQPGALPGLLQLLLSAHAADQQPAVQAAAWALSTLALAGEAEAEAVAEAGAPAALVQLLGSEREEAQVAAAHAIADLCYAGQCQPEVLEAGAVPPLVRLLGADSHPAACAAALALAVFTRCPDEEPALAVLDAGGVLPLVRCSRSWTRRRTGGRWRTWRTP